MNEPAQGREGGVPPKTRTDAGHGGPKGHRSASGIRDLGLCPPAQPHGRAPRTGRPGTCERVLRLLSLISVPTTAGLFAWAWFRQELWYAPLASLICGLCCSLARDMLWLSRDTRERREEEHKRNATP